MRRVASPRREVPTRVGDEDAEGPLPSALTSKGSGPDGRHFGFPGSSSGRTPALTSEETYVRIVDRGPQSGTSRHRPGDRPLSSTPGIGPQA